jgi:hypothetical protein
MCKFVVVFGKNNTPGTSGTRYEIYDTVVFDPKKDIENQMRKYAYRQFFSQGKRAWKLRNEVFCRRRHVVLHNGTIFAERIKIFDHEVSNEYFGFIPQECFEF